MLLDSSEIGGYGVDHPMRQGKVWMRLHKEGRKRLAKLLLIQGVTHRELAAAAGWKSHGMVAHLIQGRRSGVEPAAAVAIAKRLGVEVSDLFLTELSSDATQVTRVAS